MKVLIIGAGGHAQVIADLIIQRRKFGEEIELLGFLDDNPDASSETPTITRRIGSIELLNSIVCDGMVIGIGDNHTRERLFTRAKNLGHKMVSFIHPQAIVSPSARIGEGTVIFGGAVVNTGAVIGENVIINTGATVDHHNYIASHVHIGPGVHLGGTVAVHEGAFLGIGVAVLPNIMIGEWSVVGAGGVVTRDLPDHVTAIGMPAKVIKKIPIRVLIMGAGGHSKVVANTILACNKTENVFSIVGILDDNSDLHNKSFMGITVLGGITRLREFEHDAIVVGIGDNLTRQKLYLELKERGENLITVIHPRATLAADVVVGDGTVIFAGVVVNSGARIGSNVILNTACTVGHDLIVSTHAQIGPGVNLGGGVTVGEGAFVGIGSTVIQNKTIGNWAIVGAGAAVIHDVPAFETVVGVPAMPLHKQPTKDKPDTQDLNKSISKGSSEIIQMNDVVNWQNIVNTSYQFDFYHTLEYHLIAEKMGEGNPILFVYQDSLHRIALPFLLRPIHNEVWFPVGHQDVFDVTSVYGYTGPISSKRDLPAEFIEHFSISLMNTLRDLRVVSIFSRLHPLIDFGSSFDNYFRRKMIGETISIDLTIPSEVQKSLYRTDHKQGIKRLKKAGFYCIEDTELNYLDDFVRIYTETMLMVGADASYLFDKIYFENLLKNMSKTMHLFVCMLNQEVACAGIFSLCGSIIQYHLSGSCSKFRKYAPMKLLLDFVRDWGNDHAAHTFHLGGGVGSKRDSLFDFKAGFSNRRHTFAVWEKILFPDEYKLLCNAKADYDRKNNLQNSNGSFFPLYRSTGRENLSLV